MGLWRAIVWGFGATLGSRAADKTIAEASEALEPEETAAARTATNGKEEKLMAEGMEARRRRAEARRNRDIDQELALLKRKIAERDRR